MKNQSFKLTTQQLTTTYNTTTMVQIRTETMTIDKLRDLASTCHKPQYQRCAYWTKVNTNKYSYPKPSMEKYIEFLCKYQHSIEPIVIGKEMDGTTIICDGNNRINAILYTLEHPYEIYPHYYTTIFEKIAKLDDLTQKEQVFLVNKIKLMDYEYMFEANNVEGILNPNDNELRADSSEQIILNKLSNNNRSVRNFNCAIKKWNKKFGVKHGRRSKSINLMSDINIIVNFYEDYSSDEMAHLFHRLNEYSNTMTINDQMASILFGDRVKLNNNDLEHKLLLKIQEYYHTRNQTYETSLTQFDIADVSKYVLNPFDFIVSLQNYCSDEYGLLDNFKPQINQLSEFFILFSVLYSTKKDNYYLSNKCFTSKNINDFHEKIIDACKILKYAMDQLFSETFMKVAFRTKSQRKIFKKFKKTRIQFLLLNIIIKVSELKLNNSMTFHKIQNYVSGLLRPIILYHKILENCNLSSEMRKSFKLNDLLNIRLHWNSWMSDIKIKTSFSKIECDSNLENKEPVVLNKDIFHKFLETVLSLENQNDRVFQLIFNCLYPETQCTMKRILQLFKKNKKQYISQCLRSLFQSYEQHPRQIEVASNEIYDIFEQPEQPEQLARSVNLQIRRKRRNPSTSFNPTKISK